MGREVERHTSILQRERERKSLLRTREQVNAGLSAVRHSLAAAGHREIRAGIDSLLRQMPAVKTDRDRLTDQVASHDRRRDAPDSGLNHR